MTNGFFLRDAVSRLRTSIQDARENKATKKNRVISETEKALNALEYDLKSAEAKVL